MILRYHRAECLTPLEFSFMNCFHVIPFEQKSINFVKFVAHIYRRTANILPRDSFKGSDFPAFLKALLAQILRMTNFEDLIFFFKSLELIGGLNRTALIW